MNNKKLTITILILALVAGAVWIFKAENTNKPQSEREKFFSKDQISSSDVVIRQTESGYEPETITIKKGQRVVWVNETNTFIWPASNLHPTHNIYPEFDPREPFDKGMAWSFTFDEVGEWSFHDHLKPNRRGMVKVEE
ncbi:MAG TPA: hypothetical protein VD998_01805 [Verrucomicrobiae bacterium]|nr:hypothetical protein [Verrucomicrobiae bacterium]